MDRRMLGGLVAFAVMSVLASLPAGATPSVGGCVTVQLDSPFRLPDGVVHAPGALTLCDTKSYSPVAEFHVVLVNGSTVGVFKSQRRSTELGRLDAPQVVFERDPQGVLSLVGYIVPMSGRSVAFRLKGVSESWQAARRDPVGGAAAAPVAAIIAATGTR